MAWEKGPVDSDLPFSKWPRNLCSYAHNPKGATCGKAGGPQSPDDCHGPSFALEADACKPLERLRPWLLWETLAGGLQTAHIWCA